VREHPRTRTSTELLFLLDALLQGSRVTLALLLETSPPRQMQWTRQENWQADELFARCYTRDVRRFCLALLVGLLSVSASGASSLIVPEPCAGYEETGREDAACPPTCVTCGCCAQAAEPVQLVVTITLHAPVAPGAAVVPALPDVAPRDILHVPKSRLS
jgi:hypothetical protein